MTREEKVSRVLTDLSYTGYTPELIKFEARSLIEELFKENQKQKEIIDKIKEWEQNHTILVYTKKAPRQLVGAYDLLHLLYDEEME